MLGILWGAFMDTAWAGILVIHVHVCTCIFIQVPRLVWLALYIPPGCIYICITFDGKAHNCMVFLIIVL